MSLDYFANCTTKSSNKRFGLCDEPAPNTNPAYIDEDNPQNWIGIVNNPTEKNVQFNAIDNCIDIRREDGSQDSKCDGVLSYERNLIFIELKERNNKKWFNKGRKQLSATIKRFKEEYNVSEFDSIKAFVCNNLRPNVHRGQFSNIEKFKEETGYILQGKREINI